MDFGAQTKLWVSYQPQVLVGVCDVDIGHFELSSLLLASKYIGIFGAYWLGQCKL